MKDMSEAKDLRDLVLRMKNCFNCNHSIEKSVKVIQNVTTSEAYIYRCKMQLKKSERPFQSNCQYWQIKQEK